MSCGTGWSATSSTRTRATTRRPSRPRRGRRRTGPGGGADEHRDRERVRHRGRRDGAVRGRPAHAGPARGEPAGRAVGDRGGHRDDVLAARAVDGRARSDRRAGLPDGRAGHRAQPGRAGAGADAARRRRPLPGVRAPRRPYGRSFPGRGAGAADHARGAPPARLRPRRAGGGAGDVRPAGLAAAVLAGGRAVPMSHADIVLLVLAGLLVPLAGGLAAVESALLRVSAARVEELEREGTGGAATLRTVLVDLPRHTNLLLRLVCELTATTLVAAVMISHFGAGWTGISLTVAGMVVVSYVLVGVGPRTIGRQHPYRVALATAGLVRTVVRVLGPLASLLILLGNAITPGRGFREGPFATEVELRELVDLAEQRGVVEHGERNMIHSVFELGDTIAREVMVPRTEVVWIERGKSVRQALALALRSGFSRIPVIGENVDDIIGIAYLKDLAARAQDPQAPRTKVEELMRPPAFVPESKPVDELLREMQARRTHMAVVIDEYGGTAGVLTIEDILEEIVGEIADEYDTERAPVEWVDADTARLTARMAVEDLGDLFNTPVPDAGDVETVGGLLARELGRVPIPGATVSFDGLTLTAETTGGRRNRIDTVLVHREPVGEPEPESERDGRRRSRDRQP